MHPRVVVIEYNDRLGPDVSLTIRYHPDFRYPQSPHYFYVGASLLALAKLGQRKGYRLVAVERAGVNAFFVREDVEAFCFPTLVPQEAFQYHQRSLKRRLTPSERQHILASLPFISV